MLKKSRIILLGVGISILLSLSSCHVKQEDVKTIARATGDSLRIYQVNDFIEYNVKAISSLAPATPSVGTLRVQWNQLSSSLIDPIDGFTNYSSSNTILKETTTIIYEPGSIEPDETIIRYISQDSAGNITLYAIDDGTLPFYWLYDPATTGTLSSPTIQPTILNSPITFGTPPSSPMSYSVMEGCGSLPGVCQSEIYTFNDSFEIVGDTTSVTTNLGIFSNPFEINIIGGTVPAGGATIAFWAGIHNACGDSTETITHNGTMFVMPEIGMVKMEYFCRNLFGDSVNYIYTINNTSFY